MPLRDCLGFRLVRQLGQPSQNHQEPLQNDHLLERSHLIIPGTDLENNCGRRMTVTMLGSVKGDRMTRGCKHHPLFPRMTPLSRPHAGWFPLSPTYICLGCGIVRQYGHSSQKPNLNLQGASTNRPALRASSPNGGFSLR